MTLIDNLTNFANQQTTLILDDGTTVDLVLLFNAATDRWVMSVTYLDKIIESLGLCTLPNVLRQWMNVLPFGIACVTADQTDPFDINDFSTGRVKLYLLTAADVAQIETKIYTAP